MNEAYDLMSHGGSVFTVGINILEGVVVEGPSSGFSYFIGRVEEFVSAIL